MTPRPNAKKAARLPGRLFEIEFQPLDQAIIAPFKWVSAAMKASMLPRFS
jgi:hypothetical protein